MSLLKVFKSEKYRASPVPSHQQTYNEEEELEMLIDSTFPLPRAEGIKRSRISDRFRSCALLCAGALAFFSIQAAFFRTSSHRDLTGPEATYTHPLLPVKAETWSDRWQDNLLPDARYVTTIFFDGQTNQIHALTNLLLIAKRTQRIALLGALMPTHIEGGEWARLSEFYDLERFTRLTGIPVLEVAEVQRNTSDPDVPPYSHIGCWSTNEVMGGEPFNSGLDSYRIAFDKWPFPSSITPFEGQDNQLTFTELVAFDQDLKVKREWIDAIKADRERAVATLEATTGRRLPDSGAVAPDESILCFDNLFFIHTADQSSPAFEPDEFGLTHGSFLETGQYLHFSARIDDIVDGIMKKLFRSVDLEFLAIHIRRGDFGTDRELDTYTSALSRLHDELRTSSTIRGRPEDLPVVVVTDEQDPQYLANIAAQGWKIYDHQAEGTEENYGPWYPSTLDIALLSRSSGIVGTQGSTFSLMSMLRIQAWREAPSVWA